MVFVQYCQTVFTCRHTYILETFFSIFLCLCAAVTVKMILVVKGKDATLNPDTETQRDDLILWMFGDQDNLIAQMIGETKETTYADADERFRDRLQLDKNTGSLTINNITSGPYKLQIVSSRSTSYRKFRVFICCESFSFTSNPQINPH